MLPASRAPGDDFRRPHRQPGIVEGGLERLVNLGPEFCFVTPRLSEMFSNHSQCCFGAEIPALSLIHLPHEVIFNQLAKFSTGKIADELVDLLLIDFAGRIAFGRLPQ